MKRLILTLALLALSSSSASAEGITCGIKGGINLADLTGDDIYNNEMKLAFGGGVFLNYAITNVIGIQPEILYILKGTKSEVLENTGIHLSYIDIPLLAKFSIPTDVDFVPYFLAGPSFGILMSAKYERLLEEEDIKDDLTSLDFGLVFGLGFDYMIGRGRLLFDIRYAFGLKTIFEEEDSEALDVKNTGIIFMIGYGYAF